MPNRKAGRKVRVKKSASSKSAKQTNPRTRPKKKSPPRSTASKPSTSSRGTAKPSKQIVKLRQSARKLSNRKTFTLESLSRRKHRKLANLIKDIEQNAAAIDALKEPEPKEWWAFRIYGNRSYQVYGTIDLLINRLQQYESINKVLNSRGKTASGLIQNISILRSSNPKDWRAEKNKEVSKRNQKKKEFKQKKQREEKRLRAKVKKQAAEIKRLKAKNKKKPAKKRGKKK